MLTLLKELYSLLDSDQRKKLVVLQVLVILMAILEVIGVASIGPFMALVGDIDLINKNAIIFSVYSSLGFKNSTNFLIFSASIVLVILFIATIFSIFTLFRLQIYGNRVGAQISNRLFRHYMTQSWTFHSSRNSAELMNKITVETTRVNVGILQQLMHLNAKFIMTIVMVSALIFFEPWITIFGLVLISSVYLALYKFSHLRLNRNGWIATIKNEERFKLMGDGFGGIKDVLVTGRQSVFVNRFSKASFEAAHALASTQVLAMVPRYAMELIAFGSMISLVLFLLIVQIAELASIIPLLSIYALAGFKLLPALQQIYMSLAIIKGDLSAFKNIKDDLIESAESTNKKPSNTLEISSFKLSKNIVFENLNYSYPSSAIKALDDISLSISAQNIIGLVGSSGSGKSTAVDILLGLITPSSGRVLIDGVELSMENMRDWQNNIGFVAQTIFLADLSIRENIAFGIEPSDIDDDRIQEVIKMANLDDYLFTLPEGTSTQVGERGVQLSGGQRQRIGIARALYNNPSVLVFDEATSSLDGISEKVIMDAIHSLSGTKTIILVAHRLATVKKCDSLFLLEKGRIIDHGTYDDLLQTNAIFQEMNEHA